MNYVSKCNFNFWKNVTILFLLNKKNLAKILCWLKKLCTSFTGNQNTSVCTVCVCNSFKGKKCRKKRSEKEWERVRKSENEWERVRKSEKDWERGTNRGRKRGRKRDGERESEIWLWGCFIFHYPMGNEIRRDWFWECWMDNRD